MVAPLAAAMSRDIAFVIEVGGWQGPAWQQDAVRVEAELRAAGFSQADIERAVEFARMRMKLIRGAGPFEALEKAQNSVKALTWFRSVHECDRALFESARRAVEYDTTESWSRVRCPVLVIYGARDASSGPPEPLVAIIRRGLAAAENRDVTVKIVPDADHGICRAKHAGDRGADTRPRNKTTGPDFAPGYLETMTDWLLLRFGHATDPR
jgi:pimeloyl-ACP methyl ester carboxylesterase